MVCDRADWGADRGAAGSCRSVPRDCVTGNDRAFHCSGSGSLFLVGMR